MVLTLDTQIIVHFMHQLIIPVYRVSLCLIGMSNVNPLHDTPLVDLSVGFHWAHMT